MANFSNDVQQIQGGGLSPTSPVQDNSAAQAIEGVGSAFSSIGPALIRSNAANAKAKMATYKADAVVNFAQQQLKIAAAVDQNGMSSATARMRARDNYVQAITNNPLAYKEITDEHNKIIGNAGLGKIIATGTEQEQLHEKNLVKANAAGFTGDNAVDDWEARQRAVGDLNYAKSQTDLTNAQLATIISKQSIGLNVLRKDSLENTIRNQGVTYSTGIINLQKAINNKNANAAVEKLGTTQAPVFYGAVADATAYYKKTGDAQGALSQVEKAYAPIGMAEGINPNADSSNIAHIVGPYKEMVNNFKEYVSGKVDADSFQNKLVSTITAQKLAILASNPELKNLVAQSDIAKNASPQVKVQIDQNLVDALAKMSVSHDPKLGTSGPINLIGNDGTDIRATGKKYLDTIAASIIRSNSGIATPKENDEIPIHMANALRTLNHFRNPSGNIQNYSDVANFLANPQVNQYAAKHGGVYSTDDLQVAKEIFNDEYTVKAKHAIRTAWDNSDVPAFSGQQTNSSATQSARLPKAPKSVDVKALIEPKFSGTGVKFVPKDKSNTDATATAAYYNSNLAPVVNRTLMIDATLNGTSNFKKIYDSDFAPLFEVKDENTNN